MQESAFLQGGGLQVGSLLGGEERESEKWLQRGGHTKKNRGKRWSTEIFSICRVEMMIHYLNKTTHTKHTKGI